MRCKATLFLICVLTLVFLASGCAVSPKLQDEYTKVGLSQGMCGVFDEYRQSIPKMMAEHKIPGLSIAVVDRDGILWTAGFGYADDERKTPITPDTIFSIQSMSKTFTATAVMFAVQDGLVELDVPITRYLPDFTVNSRFEENPQDTITLRHLLTHTAGFAHEAPIGNNWDAQLTSFEEHVKSISDTWLKHRVGVKYSYSNLGVDLAAYILQVKSGKPFAQYMKEKIFDPLDMPNSSVDMEFIRRHPNRAIGHQRHFKKVPLEIPMIGAGGVYTNANELAKFVQFHINNGRVDGLKVLEKNLLREMYTATSLNTGQAMGVGIVVIDEKGTRNPSPEDKNIANKFYGLGHGGGGFGFGTAMGWYPEYGIGCLVLTNTANSDPWVFEANTLRKLINEHFVEKHLSFDIPLCKIVNSKNSESVVYQRPDSDSFTRYQPAWKKYIGTYRYMMSGWKFHTYARVALALGYPELQAKVYEKNGYLEIDGERLDEHLPGLFFSDDGDCLDLRGAEPTWKNFRMKKIR